MPLPDELLHAISSPGGGRVALILGAGCSVEAPTNIPVARTISLEIHRLLVNDGVLRNGDCAIPEDLSLVTDEVFARTGSQRAIVERFLSQYNLKLAPANEGYLIAAAMLCEGAIASIVTLNFDLGLSTALSYLGAGSVEVIERPEDLSKQKLINVYYLHRNANSADPELWVLRSAALQDEWRNQWERIITTKVLVAPIVVFIGLGSPIAVLLESSKLLFNALPDVTEIYQVDPSEQADSRFFQESGLDPSHYLQFGWGEFMNQLAERQVIEYRDQLLAASRRKVQEDELPAEDIGDILSQLTSLGLVKQGILRATWLLHNEPYRRVDPVALGLIADLLLAIAMIARNSGASSVIFENGTIEFLRDDRTVSAYIVVSGQGHRGRLAIAAQVLQRRRGYEGRHTPNGIIVGGTSDYVHLPTPPDDIARGNLSTNDVIGPVGLPMYHIDALRADPDRIREVVP